MGLKKILSGIYYKLSGESYKLQVKKLCGIELNVLPGTIREVPDQDDHWFFELAKHHEVIYDIGANVGYTALLALIQNPNRPYVLVDPNPKALGRACINLMSNNLGFNANYYCGFINDKNDTSINFYTVGSGPAGSMYPDHAKSASSVGSFFKVKTATLDNLFRYYNIVPDLVKIDVEGAETHVLKGASKVARNTNCTFFIEMHNVASLPMETAGNEVLTWAEEHDYRVWYLKEGVLIESAELIKNRGKCHLLLLPKEKEYPDYLVGIQQSSKLPDKLQNVI